MQKSDRIRAFIERQMPMTLEFLRSMVAINSYTANPTGVNQLARLTAAQFEPLGFTAEFIPSANPAYGNHLVMTRLGRSNRSIGLVSHLDTVFPPEEELSNAFHWQIEGDRIYGPGTNDIKGGTAMMWLVLTTLSAEEPEVLDSVTWKLMWNSSEECFSPDFGDVCRRHLDSRTIAALVFESEDRLGSDSLLVVARKGRATWRVAVKGRGAHAGGKHEHGANAIVQAGDLVERIAGLTDYARMLTFNVATISGGTVLNRVPHKTVIEGEFRTFDPEIYNKAKSDLLALTGSGIVRSAADGYPCQIQASVLTESRPWPRNAQTDRLFSIWKAASEELGMVVDSQERGGLSDGNLLWDSVPTLDGLGPWGDHGHCSERSADGTKLPEYVEISSFVPKALLNTVAILKLTTAQ